MLLKNQKNQVFFICSCKLRQNCLFFFIFYNLFSLSLYLLDGVRQFVIVTAIDKIGVPNFDIKKAYSYHCVRSHCEKVSNEFNIDLLHVIPVSNYFEEVAPNDAKNAMSLFNFWRIFKSGKEYIERQWNKQDANDDFGRLIMREK